MTEYLEIEKSKVLDAAKECPDWEKRLRKLFPECWEREINVNNLSPGRTRIFASLDFERANLPDDVIQICDSTACSLRSKSFALLRIDGIDWKLEESMGGLHLVVSRNET